MNKNGYDQFFIKASEIKRGDTVDKVLFSMKTKAATNKQAAAKAKSDDQKLRKNLNVKKAKATIPWKAVAGLSASLFFAGVYVLSPDVYEKWFNKIEISAFGAASAEEKAAEKSKAAAVLKEKPAALTAAGVHGKGLEEKSAIAEELSHYDKLKQRKDELDLREKELTELEEELQKQKVELDKRITQLEDMRSHIAQTLKERVDVDQEKVNKLVDLYSNMKPKQAADIIASINEELAVEVLAKMKKKNAAEIMNLLPQEKARVLSEKYTGYRRISSQEPKG